MFLASLMSEKRSYGQPVSLKDLPGLQHIFGCGPTAAGVDVTPQSSLSLPDVWACVDIIARTVSSLPLPLYRTYQVSGRVAKYEDFDNPLYDLIMNNPNPEQTSYRWRHLMSVHQNLWGAGVSEIEFDGKGQPKSLWPIPPWRVTPARTDKKELVYRVSVPNGQEKILRNDQVVVFQALTTSPDKFMSPICVHRETIGATEAVKDFGARTFGQGINPAGILTGVVFGKEETQKSLREKYGGYEGLGESHRMMFLEEGQEFKRVGLPPEDAQYLETRKLNTAEIARIYHVPLHLVQLTEKATTWGSGIEELNRGFVMLTMLPDFVQWEQELNKKLVFESGKFFKFDVKAMLRANYKDRVEGYWREFQMGSLNQNEIRYFEDRNPIEGEYGETYMVPMNMVKLEDAGKIADKNNQNNEGGGNGTE